MSKLQRLQQRVASAERAAASACAVQVTQRRALGEQIRHHWVPRGLVIGGAVIGFWLDGRLRGSGSGSDRQRQAPTSTDDRRDDSSHQASDIAVWFGLAASALRLADRWGPVVERWWASRSAPVADDPEAAQSDAANQADLIDDAEPASRFTRPA